MAMNGNDLGNKIADDVLAVAGASLNGAEKAIVRAGWLTIANDIVTHIDTQAQIFPGSFVAGAVPVTGIGDIN